MERKFSATKFFPEEFEAIPARNDQKSYRTPKIIQPGTLVSNYSARAISASRKRARSSKRGSKRMKVSLLAAVRLENPREQITYLDLSYPVTLTRNLAIGTDNVNIVVRLSTLLLTSGAGIMRREIMPFSLFVPISCKIEAAVMTAANSTGDNSTPTQAMSMWIDRGAAATRTPEGLVNGPSYDVAPAGSRTLKIKWREWGAATKYDTHSAMDDLDFGQFHLSAPTWQTTALVAYEIAVLKIRFKIYVWGRGNI